MNNLSVVISSPSDRENLVFEIWSGTCQVAEISREPGRVAEIEIYVHPQGGTWSFDLNEFVSVLNKIIADLDGKN